MLLDADGHMNLALVKKALKQSHLLKDSLIRLDYFADELVKERNLIFPLYTIVKNVLNNGMAGC